MVPDGTFELGVADFVGELLIAGVVDSGRVDVREPTVFEDPTSVWVFEDDVSECVLWTELEGVVVPVPASWPG